MRPTAALALLGLLAVSLAGCSGGGDDGSGTPQAGSSSSTSTAPPPPPRPTTETLHFLAAPDMSTVLPGSESRTPVGFGGGGGPGPGGGQPPARWTYQVTTATNVTGGEVHVWVDVKETMVETPSPPGQTPCTWQLTVNVGGDTAPLEHCANEPPGPINVGVRELVFSLVLTNAIDMEANETIIVTLTRSAFSLSANNAVDALSGSEAHDSRITLRGLKEPIDD